MEFATNARAIGGFVRWMTRDIDSQRTDRPARVPLSGAQAAALLRIGRAPRRETERADGGTNGAVAGAAAPGTAAPQAPAGRTAGRITLAVLGLAGFSVMVQVNSEQVPPNAPQSSGLVRRAPDTGAGHLHDTVQGHHKMLNKLTSVTAAAVVGIAATVAGAQSGAVQWRAADGGNGHWYQLRWSISLLCWSDARQRCESLGGHLATITSAAENSLLLGLTVPENPGGILGGPYIGGTCEGLPWGQWYWITGEPFRFTAWTPGAPNGSGGATEPYLHFWRWQSLGWNDAGDCGDGMLCYLIEWDADCNSDGIVDYGQCLNGTLADYNTNNIPDCCERGEPCVVGNYPFQWRVADGGNDHWYQITQRTYGTYDWLETRATCLSAGGDLASFESSSEWLFMRTRCRELPPGPVNSGQLLAGGRRAAGSSSQWTWLTGQAFSYFAWNAGTPNDGDGADLVLCVGAGIGSASTFDGWDDWFVVLVSSGFITEWSADCNNDNIVDYGQILTGQLADSNTNGIPDICEQPRCQDADITNNQIIDGADLGAMLAFWGPVNPVLPQADINRDGDVNGADLGSLLSFWGPCP